MQLLALKGIVQAENHFVSHLTRVPPSFRSEGGKNDHFA